MFHIIVYYQQLPLAFYYNFIFFNKLLLKFFTQYKKMLNVIVYCDPTCARDVV